MTVVTCINAPARYSSSTVSDNGAGLRRTRLLPAGISFTRDVGAALFIVMGLVGIGLSALWNPLVLTPRVWDTDVFLRSVVLDAALIAGGMGLIARRRWAGLLAATAGLVIAADVGISIGVWGLVLLLLPSLVTATCWRALTAASPKRDTAIVVLGVMLSVMVNAAAYAAHSHHWR